MRKVFLDDLPKRKGNKDQINWVLSKRYKVKFIYDDIKGEIEIVDYKSKKSRIYIKYLDNEIFDISTGSFTECKFGKILGIYTNEFKVEIGMIFKDEKRNLIITDREIRTRYKKDGSKINEKWYKYICNKCGWTEGWIVESYLLKSVKSRGCSCCSDRTIVQGINDIPTAEPWMIPYFQGGYDEAKLYCSQSNKKVHPICPDCGRIKDKPMTIGTIYRTRSIACTCSDGISYPNKFAYSLLNQLNRIYKFEHLEGEYSPKWIKPKRYDFYFVYKGKKYIIEMDGSFHNKDNEMSGQTKEESKYIDDNKDRLALENGVKVIRINCDISDIEYIKNNILNSELIYIFDLNEIDWLECERFALGNLVKIACDLWNSGIESTLEISKIMKLSKTTITKYLKKSTKIGWCVYDAEEEYLKGVRKLNKNGKQVELFKNKESLGIFPSCSELERQSEKLFGVKLLRSNISNVLIGNRPHYKGFTFKYINEIEQTI